MESVYSPFDFDDHPYLGGGSAAALSVTLLTRHLASVIRSDEILQDIWVRGEVSNFTRAGSGHLYFSLKDEGACAGCVMWRSAAARLGFALTPGMQVVAHGQVEVYPQRGQYQLIIDAIIPDGAGARHLALEQARERMLQEGLLDADRKRRIPFFPERVAVITSLHGAAVQDICVTLRSRPFPPEIVIVPAQVQGDLAEESLLAALKVANERSGADLIIAGRGGGSIEDLWCFNSERVARAIANSRLPVISAVGHETDFTLADLAADHRAATPTAAAELVTLRREEAVARLFDAERRARAALVTRLEYSRLRWDGIRRRSALTRPVEVVERQRQRLDDLHSRLLRARSASLQRWQHRLSLAAGRLHGLSPLSTLARGYAVVTRLPEQTALTSAAQVRPGDRVQLRLADGTVETEVLQVRIEAEQRDEKSDE